MSFTTGTQEQQVSTPFATSDVRSSSSGNSLRDQSGSSDHSSSHSTSNSRSTVSPTESQTNWKTKTQQRQQQQPQKPQPAQQQQQQQQQPTHNHPYRNILTHQERKKLRMPKRKADSWPASILGDPDVLSLDDEGRFVLCKVCHVHYAVHGGKKPKPVIMNSSFRTRAWDVHKERTNSHRMQKRPDDPSVASSRRQATIHPNEDQKEAHESKTHAADLKKPSQQQQQQKQKQQKQQQQQQQQEVQPPIVDDQQAHRYQPQQQRFAPPVAATAAAAATSQQNHSPLGRPELLNPSSPRRRVFRTNAQLSSHQWQPADHDAHPRMHSSHEHMNAATPASSTVVTSSTVVASSSSHGRKSMTNASMASEQRDGMMRWRHMHDDVSRALSSMPKRPAQDQYPNGDLRTSTAVVLGDTEDFGGNNEKVAKKLKSLDEEYDAKTLKRPDVHCDRRSANYKQYWGTLRDVYTASSNKPLPSLRRTNSSSNNNNNNNHYSNMSKDTQDGGDATTPDDAGSSEDSAKTVVVHDQALVNAIDRLTGIVSKQLSDRHANENSATIDALSNLTSAVTEMGVQQSNAYGRIIELQEQRLQVMEAILQHKLRKESRNGSNKNSGAS